MSEPVMRPDTPDAEDALVLGATPAASSPVATACLAPSPPAAWARSGAPTTKSRSDPSRSNCSAPEFVEDPNFVERFRAEARTAGMLHHPNIAAVYDYGERADLDGRTRYAFLVLEMVDGESLATRQRRQRALSPADTLDIVGQAAIALQAAHDAGVIHRDIKPANLLLCPDGTVKITDFGIARAAGALALTRTGTVLGTAHYLSPEQVTGRPASPASDIYALGVVAYECLAGRRPFDADSPIEVALSHQRDPVPDLPPGLPPTIRDLVLRALAKDPAGRPQSAGSYGRTALAIRDALYSDPAPIDTAPIDTAPTSPSIDTSPVDARRVDTAPVDTGRASTDPRYALTTTPPPTGVSANTATATGVERAALSAASVGSHPPTRSLPTQRGPRRGPPTVHRTVRLPSLVLLALIVAVVVFAALHHGHTTSHNTAAAAHHTHVTGHPSTATTAHTAPSVAVSAPPSPASVGSSGPAGIAINPEALSGLPAATAISQLDALGLSAIAEPVQQSGTPGTVVTVVSEENSPLPALLAPGTTVNVMVVAQP